MSGQLSHRERSIAECIGSLQQAIRDAHGGVPSVRSILEMTMAEFLDRYAQNDIRFQYVDPAKPTKSGYFFGDDIQRILKGCHAK